MNKTMCPGQDTRFWQPGDIFDSKCGNCGNPIEFFKDDASQKCKKCGTRIQNPKLNMGCAQWCEHAEECLGYDPKTIDADNVENKPGLDVSISDKILNEIKAEFKENSSEYKTAIQIREVVDNLLDEKPGRPRIVIPAALLANVDANTGNNDNESEIITVAKRIMNSIGLDKATVEDVAEILVAIHLNQTVECDEFKVVTESINTIKGTNIVTN